MGDLRDMTDSPETCISRQGVIAPFSWVEPRCARSRLGDPARQTVSRREVAYAWNYSGLHDRRDGPDRGASFATPRPSPRNVSSADSLGDEHERHAHVMPSTPDRESKTHLYMRVGGKKNSASHSNRVHQARKAVRIGTTTTQASERLADEQAQLAKWISKLPLGSAIHRKGAKSAD